MSGQAEVVGLLSRDGSRGGKVADDTFEALRAYADAQFEASADGDTPRFAHFVASLDMPGLLAFAGGTTCLSAWGGRAGSAWQQGRAAQRQMEAVRDAAWRAMQRVAQEWRATAGQATEPRRDALAMAMARLVSAGADLRDGGAALDEMLNAFYKKGDPAELRRLADDQVCRLLALQSRGHRGPFNSEVDAIDLRAGATERSPGLERRIADAIVEDMGLIRDRGAIARHERGGHAPPDSAPRIREARTGTFRIWDMDVNGTTLTGRDPFLGPAVVQTSLDGTVAMQNFVWKGERLGPDLGDALERLREIDPDGYAACARRFAEGFRGDPGTLPAPLREALAGAPAAGPSPGTR